ncbi:FAD-binding domain-containing protein [Chamaesiphon polymorphus]|uniref:Deoxyribodipyrimidine photolyase n=1 Tax=Chamaesiphon polymorphus CCALA 037 TaxID=2107692 RepID=A0A2T1GGK7_9CYAN|nr:FAD-binding domain-containing protein [Chamaesiphon polymorphus]PSB56799.1 deoxyribodipyrimidine photolyase [Chamaesiphon polymorphus CCALA 037]
MSDLILFWHRRDLRVSDSIGLAQACNTNARVIGVFCFDRAILTNDSVAPARVAYLVGCLKSLAEDYRRAGSQLLFVEGNPVVKIPLLATTLAAKAVYWHLDIEPYSQTRDESIATTLKSHNIEVHTSWDQLLHAPTEITTGNKQPYTVYTPFWRNWSSRSKPAPVEVKLPPSQLEANELSALTQVPTIDLPTAKDLGFIWENPLKLEPGTSAAARELEAFCHRSICEYDEQRNYPAIAGTSGLSSALKFGVIGIRTVWAATIEAMAETRSDEARAGITTWQQELAWREFYQQAMYHFPSLAQGAYRDALKHFPWQDDGDRFEAWCRGETGYPIVDAAMRQLNEIGWMHNRCRMIVASFLTKDLIINWQWGEKYFMQRLIDGDLSANNGGWQWSASSGMDPKPLRIFNPYTQAQKFDPEADYIRQWVPELKSVDTNLILKGNIPPLTCHQIGYPLPIVEHSVQQRLFKDLYASVKGAA